MPSQPGNHPAGRGAHAPEQPADVGDGADVELEAAVATRHHHAEEPGVDDIGDRLGGQPAIDLGLPRAFGDRRKQRLDACHQLITARSVRVRTRGALRGAFNDHPGPPAVAAKSDRLRRSGTRVVSGRAGRPWCIRARGGVSTVREYVHIENRIDEFVCKTGRTCDEPLRLPLTNLPSTMGRWRAGTWLHHSPD